MEQRARWEMNLLLPHLNVLILFLSGIAAAVVLFVAIGLLLDLVPREVEKRPDSSRKRGWWLLRLFHLGLSH
jgi:hypothetical protein